MPPCLAQSSCEATCTSHVPFLYLCVCAFAVTSAVRVRVRYIPPTLPPLSPSNHTPSPPYLLLVLAYTWEWSPEHGAQMASRILDGRQTKGQDGYNCKSPATPTHQRLTHRQLRGSRTTMLVLGLSNAPDLATRVYLTSPSRYRVLHPGENQRDTKHGAAKRGCRRGGGVGCERRDYLPRKITPLRPNCSHEPSARADSSQPVVRPAVPFGASR